MRTALYNLFRPWLTYFAWWIQANAEGVIEGLADIVAILGGLMLVMFLPSGSTRTADKTSADQQHKAVKAIQARQPAPLAVKPTVQ